MPQHRTVYVVDQGVAARKLICTHIVAIGAEAWPFASGNAFLELSEHLAPACILLDVEMQSPSGLEVMDELLRRGIEWPVIAIGAGSELPVAIEAMKLGAIDFLIKPIEQAALSATLARGWNALDMLIETNRTRRMAQERVAKLTAREIDISLALFSGRLNKTVAYEVGISVRTVEMHRAHILAKLGVKTLAEAALITAQAGYHVIPATPPPAPRQMAPASARPRSYPTAVTTPAVPPRRNLGPRRPVASDVHRLPVRK